MGCACRAARGTMRARTMADAGGTNLELNGGVEPTLGPTRRDVVRAGMKLVFVPPVLSTFLAREAYAVNYSCYGAGVPCSGATEPCCGTLTCIANICQ